MAGLLHERSLSLAGSGSRRIFFPAGSLGPGQTLVGYLPKVFGLATAPNIATAHFVGGEAGTTPGWFEVVAPFWPGALSHGSRSRLSRQTDQQRTPRQARSA